MQQTGRMGGSTDYSWGESSSVETRCASSSSHNVRRNYTMTGIDDLIDNEKLDPDRSINSRKNPENIDVPERAWKELLAQNPYSFYTIAVDIEENEAKCLVSMIDEALENGIEGWNLSDEQIENMKEAKQDIMKMYNGF